MDDDQRVRVRGEFARLALRELDADPEWERRIAGLTRMFPGPHELTS